MKVSRSLVDCSVHSELRHTHIRVERELKIECCTGLAKVAIKLWLPNLV